MIHMPRFTWLTHFFWDIPNMRYFIDILFHLTFKQKGYRGYSKEILCTKGCLMSATCHVKERHEFVVCMRQALHVPLVACLLDLVNPHLWYWYVEIFTQYVWRLSRFFLFKVKFSSKWSGLKLLIIISLGWWKMPRHKKVIV